jgi:hypothetical protein
VQQPPPPPTGHPAAAEVADQYVAAAAPAPEMVVPAAESVMCFGCQREPALRLVPVEHACFCPPCRSNPSRWTYCAFCDGPSVEDSGEEDSRGVPLAVHPYTE